ncbi:HNH endonuclease [Paenibacillus sp. FSL R7-0302]|uniref:HNH endonuclease n=1 Tax=Paenibacillus sp. FSL R7-0302 TaxID=2921681 RepID=UPI0030F5330D
MITTTSQNGHYLRAGTYSIEEVLSKQLDPIEDGRVVQKIRNNDLHKVDFDGDLISMDSHRYWLFKHKGVVCKRCGIVGVFFAKEKDRKANHYHFNLYALDANGDEVLMTKDHILPKSKGGKNHIDNYDTMCCKCNFKKSNK